MKKKYQYLLVIIQSIISLFFISLIIFSTIEALRFNKNLSSIHSIFISNIIQLIVYEYLAIQLCQMSEPRKWGDSPLFHYVLLALSIDGITILPSFQELTNITLISPIIVGKIHIFSLISSLLFLILCGLNQKKANIKGYNQNVLFTLSLSLVISSFIKINSPTISNHLKMITLTPLFKSFYFFLSFFAILSFLPSYLKDKTSHNKLKTYSYCFFILSIAILKSSLSLHYLLIIFLLFILITSSITLIINMKSYSI